MMERRRGKREKGESREVELLCQGEQGFTFARPLGAIGPVFMACSFPCLPSQHNELHYSALLSATIDGLFWRDTPLVVRLKLDTKLQKRQAGARKNNLKYIFF